MAVHYSTFLEETLYSKHKDAILGAADGTISRISGYDVTFSLERQYPDKDVFWCAWYAHPHFIGVVFVGAAKDVMNRARSIRDRDESEHEDVPNGSVVL